MKSYLNSSKIVSLPLIKPRKLTWEQIRQEAELFRSKYVIPKDKIPVPIEKIVEFDLGITIIPVSGLQREIDIEGFLSKDCDSMYIDNETYIDERYEKRLRFTFAHEVGHLILHKEEIINLKLDNKDDWIKFRNNFFEDDHNWFERQAHEFAGRLLVPKGKLLNEVDSIRDKIETFKVNSRAYDPDTLIESISRVICDKFNVSSDVIKIRIRYENILNELNINP